MRRCVGFGWRSVEPNQHDQPKERPDAERRHVSPMRTPVEAAGGNPRDLPPVQVVSVERGEADVSMASVGGTSDDTSQRHLIDTGFVQAVWTVTEKDLDRFRYVEGAREENEYTIRTILNDLEHGVGIYTAVRLHVERGADGRDYWVVSDGRQRTTAVKRFLQANPEVRVRLPVSYPRGWVPTKEQNDAIYATTSNHGRPRETLGQQIKRGGYPLYRLFQTLPVYIWFDGPHPESGSLDAANFIRALTTVGHHYPSSGAGSVADIMPMLTTGAEEVHTKAAAFLSAMTYAFGRADRHVIWYSTNFLRAFARVYFANVEAGIAGETIANAWKTRLATSTTFANRLKREMAIEVHGHHQRGLLHGGSAIVTLEGIIVDQMAWGTQRFEYPTVVWPRMTGRGHSTQMGPASRTVVGRLTPEKELRLREAFEKNMTIPEAATYAGVGQTTAYTRFTMWRAVGRKDL